MAENNYAVNYDDERFTQVEQDKTAALDNLNQTYDGIIGNADQYYNAQIDAAKEWGDKQAQLQQEQSDFAIEQIEQQKQQANKDYIKEQSGAYVDWQKQSNEYGVNAEKQAVSGLAGTGYSESSQVAMYNQYQNRVTTAREVYSRAVLNYDNAIKEARLQNNSILAEIAYNTLQKSLELALQGFQYKNTLVLDKLNKGIEVDNMYYQRYQDVLSQINTENALAEQIRQYNQSYQLELQKYNTQNEQWQKEYDQGIKEFEESIRQFNEEIERLKAKDEADAKAEAARLEEEKKQREQEQAQWEAEMAEKKRQFDKTFNAEYGNGAAITKSSSSGGGSGGGAAISSAPSVDVSKNKGQVVKTDYYNGVLPAATKNANTKYGTFANGYQPKGIMGYGEVSKTGNSMYVTTKTLDGKTKEVKQNVWKTPDGSLWYWEGREMQYKKLALPASGGGGGGSTNIFKTVK